jgi:DNA-binding response OmpR family regulator
MMNIKTRKMSVKKNKILIVDDDKGITDTLTIILNGEGYDTDTATNGEMALKKAENEFFHLALLDLKLPDMSGTQVLRKLHMISPRTVIIMVTGYPTIDNAVESLNLGASAYIMKPVNPEELLRFVEEKIREQEKKSINIFDNTIPLYLELIRDGNMWTVDTIAAKLNMSRTTIEKMSTFFAQNGIVKYWESRGIVQIEKSSKKTKS